MLNCNESIKNERRNEIHNEFWSMEYNLRKMWIGKYVEQYPIRRHRKRESVKVKKNCRTYKLYAMDDSAVPVCKIFFLSTLGITSDQVITTSLKSSDFVEDKRGQHFPSHKLSETKVTAIKNHTFLYQPGVSRYRHAHAPLSLYLPPELTIKEMHDDYITKHPELSIIHYNDYRETVRKYNIGFAKLGEEECENCTEHEQSLKDIKNHDSENDRESCEVCEYHEKHIKMATVSKKLYQRDQDFPDKSMLYRR